MSELDLRRAADEMGVDHSTLYRIEQGRMPSAESLRAILVWLMEKAS
jgi:transcriptional regulator with XRE-family HTH domain